jgi:hypothetical protein
MLDQLGAERAHGAVLLHRIAAWHINHGRNAVAAGREGEALPVIAARGGNDPGRIRPFPLQPVEIDQPAADLEGADRCVVLMLDDDISAEPLRQQRPRMRRRRRHRLPHDPVCALEFCEVKHFFILSLVRRPRNPTRHPRAGGDPVFQRRPSRPEKPRRTGSPGQAGR